MAKQTLELKTVGNVEAEAEPAMPMMLPDLAHLAKLGGEIAEWSNYVKQAGQMHVSHLQTQITSLQEDATMLEKEHTQALEHVNIDYQRKIDRNFAMQRQLQNMLQFYTRDGKVELNEPAKSEPENNVQRLPAPRKRGFFGLT